MVSCLSCVKACKFGAIAVNDNYTCLKIDKIEPIRIDAERCNECGLCKRNCLLGDMELSKIDCIFCIVCKGKPHCIVANEDRDTFKSFILSIVDILKLKLRLI